MDSVKPSEVAPNKSKLARTIAKVLHLRAATGIASVDGIQKVKSREKIKDDRNTGRSARSLSKSFEKNDNEQDENRASLQAHLAKLFASVSSVKAAYAQLQFAQSPYDANGIQAADILLVSELKTLSELKRCYLKKQFDLSPETAFISAEIQEQKSVCKTFEIMGKKLESQLKLKESEITFLREKLEEGIRHNRLLEKRLGQSGRLYMLDNLHLSGLNPSHLITVLHHTVKSIKSFVKLMMDEMKSAPGWDIDAAASAIDSDVIYWKPEHKCFVFESFVCQRMFDTFHCPNFSRPNQTLADKNKQRQHFFSRFTKLKSMEVREFLAQKPSSAFAKFLRAKYLLLIHPKMESSFFGNLNQRTLVNSGGFPDTAFFASFAEMGKRVWLLHCLAFSFDPEASIFQVSKGDRFSEVYMESIAEEEFLSSENSSDYDPLVAFTIVPGFKIGKTVIQCQVYLSHFRSGN